MQTTTKNNYQAMQKEAAKRKLDKKSTHCIPTALLVKSSMKMTESGKEVITKNLCLPRNINVKN